MASTGTPTAAYLERAWLSAEQRFAGRNAHILDIRKRRRNEIVPVVPEPYQKVATIFEPPYVRTLIQRTQSLISPQLPTAHRVPLKTDVPASRAEAEQIAGWFNEGANPIMQRRENTFAMVTDSLAEGGHGVWKLTLKKHRWGEGSRRRKGEDDETYNDRVDAVRKGSFPFYRQHVPTTNYFPLAYDDEGLSEVLEVSTHERSFLYGQYEKELRAVGVQIEDDVNTLEGQCQLIQYVNRDSFAYYISDGFSAGDVGTLVKSSRHRGRRPWYYHAKFSQTGVKDPAFESEAISDGVIALQDWVQVMMTEKGVWASMASYPIFVLEPISADEMGTPTIPKGFMIEWARGETTAPPPGYRWRPLELPPTGQDINQLITFIVALIDQVSLAPILFGKSQGDQSGTVMHGLVQLARAIFEPCLDSIASQFDAEAEEMLYLIEHDIKAPVPIYQASESKWLEVGPKDVKGFYRVTHTLEPIIAMERLIAYQMASDAQLKGYVDDNYVREQMPIDNPQEMADRVYVDKLEKSPQADALVWAWVQEMIAADQTPPPPSIEEITGQPVPGVGTPANVPQGMGGGPGIPQVPGIQQGIAPGLQPVPTSPAQPAGVGTT